MEGFRPPPEHRKYGPYQPQKLAVYSTITQSIDMKLKVLRDLLRGHVFPLSAGLNDDIPQLSLERTASRAYCNGDTRIVSIVDVNGVTARDSDDGENSCSGSEYESGSGSGSNCESDHSTPRRAHIDDSYVGESDSEAEEEGQSSNQNIQQARNYSVNTGNKIAYTSRGLPPPSNPIPNPRCNPAAAKSTVVVQNGISFSYNTDALTARTKSELNEQISAERQLRDMLPTRGVGGRPTYAFVAANAVVKSLSTSIAKWKLTKSTRRK
ncbi:hypothetical protein ABW19_dt0200413 [Dactylella cylindrospora]|nr:hypothetical protein ABW19_dt0200413 [Dactylella cylindrospora]